MSFEKRLSQVASLTTIVGNDAIKEFVRGLTPKLENRMAKASVDKSETVDVLAQLEECEYCSPSTHPALYLAAKSVLMQRFYWFQEFDPWIEFVKAHPALVTAADQAKMSQEFDQFQQSFSSEEDDPDRVREDALEAEQLGGRFAVNVTKAVARLKSRAADLEAEAGGGYDEGEYRGSIGAVSSFCSDAEIASMFENLR
jgi:hypothetical protein